MPPVPAPIDRILEHFAPYFRRRTWQHARVLLLGAVLATGERTVCAVLRVVGLSGERHFQNYHRVLSRATWSPLAISRLLFRLLVRAFVPEGEPVVVGLDETLERRRGKKIGPKGVWRDPVRSSRSFFVKATGLRWISFMLLAPIPWAKRVWALPFLTILAPSEHYHKERGLPHKTLTEWGRGALVLLRRWLPDREIIAVADRTYAALHLLARCQALSVPVTVLTRLRLDAALYDPAPPREPGQVGRPRKKGERQPTLRARLEDPETEWKRIRVPWYGGARSEVEVATGTAVWYHTGLPVVPLRWVLIRDPEGKKDPQALLSTDLTLGPREVIGFFVQRWQLEVTFHEVRAHLGVETQRQWSKKAIRRTTPALLALFSLVTLMAESLLEDGRTLPVRRAAWYDKPLPTFVDTLALVRRELWPVCSFSTSTTEADVVKIPRALLDRMSETLAHAA